jgi:hypothetical protein
MGKLAVDDETGEVYLDDNLMHQCIDSDGYKMVVLDGNNVPVHKIIAYIKFGDDAIKRGIVTRHLNDCKLDNSWDNIGIGTPKDNWHDMPIAKQKMTLYKTNSKLTREWRVNQSLKREAAKSPEIKSDEARRGWITRKANLARKANQNEC